jgi:pimeloyl-ACP methyl ester carboxylesterase
MTTMNDVREWDFDTGPRGLNLRIREHGAASDPVVVILHGYLEQAAAWDEVAALLPGRRVIVPDHRGHGLSDHVGAGGFYHFWDYIADVLALLDALDTTVDVVGHSMGGSIAVLATATAPERIRRLVLIEGLGIADGTSGAVDQARLAMRQRRRPTRHASMPDLENAAERLIRGNPDLSMSKAMRLASRITRSLPDGSLTWTFDPMHKLRTPQAFSAPVFMHFLKEIAAPTLLIEGQTSVFRKLPDLDERRRALRDHRLVILDDTGHNPHHTCPNVLSRHIEEHLDVGR